MTGSRRVEPPDLGPRGEGWVGLQLLAYGALAVTGLSGSRWPAGSRLSRRAGAVVLAAAGTTMLIRGSIDLGPALTPNPRPREGVGMRTGGLYARVRHPIYGGVMLVSLAWSMWLSPAALVPTALSGVLLDLKARREEAWLQERHPDYVAYRERVPRRFLPGAW